MAVLSLRLLCFVCCLLLTRANSNSQNYHYFCDQINDRGNYTANSTYETNLNNLLSTLVSNTKIDYGFYNFTYGENTDTVYGIGLCRGDVKADECRNCLEHSRANLTELCPTRKEAIGWYEDEKCMLRYSDRSIFSLNEIGPAYYAHSMENATDLDQFNKDVNTLLNNLKSQAALGDSRVKYATGNISGPDNKYIYGLVQCTPDLSGQQCDNCLAQSIARIPIDCCKDSKGGRVVRPSCNMRFETASLFYGHPEHATPKSPLLSPPSSTVTKNNNNNSSEGKGNASVDIVPLLLLLLCSFLFLFENEKAKEILL